MAGVDPIETLEKRIEILESFVYGSVEKDADYPKNLKSKTPCIESLVEIQAKINKSLAGKKKAALLYEKLPELKQYLDSAYMDGITLSNDARLETVLADSGFLEEQAALWKKLSENQDHINSEHIHAVPKNSDKLHALSQVQIEQQDAVSNLNDESRRILSAYNNVVSLLSKQFVLWDETLTQLEVKAGQKK